MKPSRDDVLRVAAECGIGIVEDRSEEYCMEYYTATGNALERFAAAMYAAGAEDMREMAAKACLLERVDSDETQADEDEAYNMALTHAFKAIRALPITPTNTEGEQGD
jgi:hypothetical protein